MGLEPVSDGPRGQSGQTESQDPHRVALSHANLSGKCALPSLTRQSVRQGEEAARHFLIESKVAHLLMERG